METTRAAEREQREVLGIEPLLEEREADRARHVRDSDLQNAFGCGFGRERQACRDMRRDRRACCGVVETHGAAEKELRVDAAEHDIGIGYRRLRAAAAVAGRPRLGAGALRSDAQATALLDARNGAAARADGADLDHREAHRQAVDRPLRDEARAAAVDDRDVVARAAHVDRDDVRHGEALGDGLGGERAAARPREQEPRGQQRRRLRAHDAAVRLHEIDRCLEARVFQPSPQALEIAPHDRHEQRIENGRR